MVPGGVEKPGVQSAGGVTGGSSVNVGPVLRREAGVFGKRCPVDAACAVCPVLWLACTAGDRRVL